MFGETNGCYQTDCEQKKKARERERDKEQENNETDRQTQHIEGKKKKDLVRFYKDSTVC